MTEVRTPLASLLDGDLASQDSNSVARVVSAADPAEIESVFAQPDLRKRVLDEIFRRMQTHARAERIGAMHAVVHWQITGGSGPDGVDRYQCVLADGTCTVSNELTESPRVTVTVSPVNFVRLISRQEIPAVLFITGALTVEGDLGFATSLAGYFDLPTG